MIDIPKFIKVSTVLFPASRVGEFSPYWISAFEYADISTVDRAAMFLGQVGIECSGFKVFEENMNYSGLRLTQVWPKRFRFPRSSDKPNLDVFADGMRNANAYANNPSKLANYVYGNRYKNGDEKSGDGWKYRGRGPKQVTFKDNYDRFNREFGLKRHKDFVKDPELLLIPEYGLDAAVWFWKTNKLNYYADMGDSKGATKIIQGGDLKLAERTALYLRARAGLL